MEEKIKNVAQSYAGRRRPSKKKILPHVKYNPDQLNSNNTNKKITKKEEDIENQLI